MTRRFLMLAILIMAMLVNISFATNWNTPTTTYYIYSCENADFLILPTGHEANAVKSCGNLGLGSMEVYMIPTKNMLATLLSAQSRGVALSKLGVAEGTTSQLIQDIGNTKWYVYNVLVGQ